MKLRHLQATAAAVLLCGSVLLGNATSYAAIGKIVKAGEVKQTESDRRDSNPRSRPWQGRALPTTPLSHLSVSRTFRV